MPVFNASSLRVVGSIKSLYLHPQNLTNDLPINSSSSSYNLLYNHNSCTPFNVLKLHRKSKNNKYPLQAAKWEINSSSSSSSGAKINEVLDGTLLPPEPPRPVRSPADWEAAKTLKETGSIYKGKVDGFNNGGILIRFYSLVGFLPFPQLSPTYSCKEPNKTIQEIAKGLVGSVLHLKVLEVDEDNKKLIFSEKEASWSNYSAKINVGDVFNARVGMVEDYGAFVNLRFPDGNYHLTGLVHVSEVSWDYVQDVRDVLTEGDEVKVKVVQVDRERSRLTLSIRQLEEDPLLETLDKVIPQDGATGPENASTSVSSDIQPLPGLEEILQGLLKEDGIKDVRIRRQGFEKRVVSQDLQLWLSNAPEVENQLIILARAGRFKKYR